MSTIKVDTITDEAGSGAPDFPNGMTGNGSSLTGLATAAQGALADTALQSSSPLAAANLTGTLPAIDGSALTGVGASTTYGAVGTYVLASNYGSGTFTSGNDKSAASVDLQASDTNGRVVGPTLSGTWRMMGLSRPGVSFGRNDYATTVWLRIA